MTIFCRRLATSVALLVAAIVAPAPAIAAEPVFPPGMRVGLVPIEGLAPAKAFPGFESADQSAKLVIAELPANAFSDLEAAIKDDKPLPTGIKPEPLETTAGPAFLTTEQAKDGPADVRRYSVIVRGEGFTGYIAMQVPADAADYADAAVRRMLASTVLRKDVSIGEQLGLMPFKVTALADFKNVRTLAPGAVILLADDDGSGGIEASPFMVIGLIASPPGQSDDRGRFAQQAAATIPGLRDARITMSEPVRIDGAPGYETRIDAVSGKNNTPVTVVQWLRFGASSAALRIIGSASQEDWPKAFPRFRAVRDGIEPR